MRKNLQNKIMLSILAGSLALGFVYAQPAFAVDVMIANGENYTAPDGTQGTYKLDADGTNNGTNYNDTSITLPTDDIGIFTVKAGNGGTAEKNGSTVGKGGSISLSTIGNIINNGVSITAGNGGYINTYSNLINFSGGSDGAVTLTFTENVEGGITSTSGNSSNLNPISIDEFYGGNGGNVNLAFTNVVNGNIDAAAGNGGHIFSYINNGNSTSGAGGNVNLTFTNVVNGNITAEAGNGGLISCYSTNGNSTGGNGGNVNLAFTNVVNGNITADAGNGGTIYANNSSGNAIGGNGGNATLTFNDIVVTDSISLTSGTNGTVNGANSTHGKGGSVAFAANNISGTQSTDNINITLNKNDGALNFHTNTLNIQNNTVTITTNGSIGDGQSQDNHIDTLLLTGNGNFITKLSNNADITVGKLAINGGTVNNDNWKNIIEHDYKDPNANTIALGENGVTFDIASDKELSKNLTGSSTGNLIKTGAGTLKLGTENENYTYDYKGLTVVKEGILDASISELTNSKGLTLFGGATFIANTSNQNWTGTKQNWYKKQIAVYDNGSDNSAIYQGDLSAQNSNLYFIASGDNTNPLLKVINNGTDNNGNVNIAGSNYNLGLTGDKFLDIGSKLTLIEADGTINADNLEPGSGIKVGSTIKQDITTNVEVSVDDSGSTEKLIATVSGALATDEASAINSGMLGGLAFNLQGADLIAHEGMEAAVRSAQLDNNHAVFAALTRSSLDYGAVDIDGTNMLAGLAWRSTTGAGSLTYGVFAEHGDGSYDTYANINGTSLHGEGDTDYTGGGILARMDFNGSENGHGYLEASGRVGNADTDYTNSGLRDAYGRAASDSTDGTYYGAHIGAGYVQKLDEKSSIDWYGKLLWARLEGGSADLSTGEHLSFDDADSLRLRIGGRWNYTARDFVSYYAGLGYEYEFDGEANGFTNGLALGDEDLTGGSGVAELGISFKPSKNSPFSLELNLAGFTGEREGFRGGVEAVYTF